MRFLERRRLLQGVLGAAAGAGLGWTPWAHRGAARAQTQPAGPPARNAASSELRNGVHRLTVGDTHLVAMTSGRGVLLVDGGSADQAADVAAVVAQLPGGGAVHTLFNTCWHRTQTGSNAAARRAGAAVIAHENARLWLTTSVTWPWDGSHFEPLPETERPNATFYGKETLEIDGRHVEYGHVRACPHTDGDTYVLFREANVLAVGNAIAGAAWPTIDWWTGGWLGGIVGALELFLELADDDTRIVPARGPVLTRADLETQHRMYDLLYERFVDLLYGGKSPAEAVAARPAAEFDGQLGNSDTFVERAFQSLWGYLTPDA